MSRRRWIALAAAVISAVVLVVVIPVVMAATKPSLVGEYDGLVWYDSFDVGTEFVAGQIALINQSDVDMTVIDVKPIMARDAQLKFLGAYLAGEDRVSALTDRRIEYPPAASWWGSFVPAPGGVVPPASSLYYDNTGIELMLAFSVGGGTRNEMRAVEVVYEVQGVRKRERINTGIVVCVPETAECPIDGLDLDE